MITVDEAFTVVDKHLRSSDAQHRTQRTNKMSATKEMELCCGSNNNVQENSALHKLQGVNQSDNFDRILPAFRTSWRDGPSPFHSHRGQAQCTTQQIVDDLIDMEIVYKNETDNNSEQCHNHKSKEEEMVELRRAWKDHKLRCTLIPSTFHTVVEPAKIVVTDCDDKLETAKNFDDKIMHKSEYTISDNSCPAPVKEIHTLCESNLYDDSKSYYKSIDEHFHTNHSNDSNYEYMNKPTNAFIVTTNPQRDRAQLQNAINTNKLKSEWSLPSHRRALLEQHCVRHYPFGAFGLTETPLTNNTGKVYREHKEQLRRLCNRQCRQLRNSDFTPPDHVFGPICTRSSPIARGRLYNAPNDHLLGALLL